MKTIFLLFFILLLIASCDKFNHLEKQYVEPCDYCSKADSIEGTYTGRHLEINFAGFSGGSEQFDTIVDTIITVSVTRSFEDLNYLEDSIVFKFNMSHFFESITFSESSIQDGVFSPSKYDYQSFTSDDKLILVKNTDVNLTYDYSYESFKFEGEKDE